ncbi:hypothetical protein MCOR34_009171 [Pyricularia oryzae]|nr:hypothetical protein MCOR34_009171 [Pyricularia oryzae]KAI6457962.1 hypothetical protein MCOR17_007608 [Pyricularia oryzae]KAI6485552.1 hypothetical protein MCOR13_009677 [Pyricularia oryzae]KAI6579080.1 hypothetical protein MCOR04_006183 [Pyricularia oryzae]
MLQKWPRPNGPRLPAFKFASLMKLKRATLSRYAVPKPLSVRDDVKPFDKPHVYYDFNEDRPPVEEFCRMMAYLHSKSVSPNGMFGFHCPTYNGDAPQDNTWCGSWEVFFSRGLRHILNLRDERGSPDPELDAMLPELFDRVIPRLLRPLETGGRRIKPCLVHGDLWCGNVSVDDDTGRPVIYDPSGFWGHHEYELGNWRPSRNKFTDYISTYYKYMEPSEPVEDLDGRNLLYSLRFNAQACTHFPDEEQWISMIKDDVAELLRRYPPDCLPPVDVGDEPLNIPQSGATQDNNIISAF